MTPYIVIVYPPADTRGVAVVRTVEAHGPKAAAEKANVSPGGRALVARAEDMARFDRATVAPLEQRHPNGAALARAEKA